MYRDLGSYQKLLVDPRIILQIPPIILVDRGTDMTENKYFDFLEKETTQLNVNNFLLNDIPMYTTRHSQDGNPCGDQW